MNTSKQINIIVLLVFASVLATGAYTLWDPGRASDAEETQLENTLERAAYLFSQNCRVCHGDAAEGGALGVRLGAAPALNDRRDLRGIDEEGNVDQVLFANTYKFVYNTITCGRVGRAMPAWAQAQGGTLNTEQIKQLTVLITQGTAWEDAREFGIRGVPDHGHPGDDQYKLFLAEPLSAGGTSVVLGTHRTLQEEETVLSPLSEGSRLSIVEGEGEDQTTEVLLITAVDEATSTVTVERGVGASDPASHAQDAEVLVPPVPPDEPAINEYACGQSASAQPTAGPAGTPTPAPTPPADAQQLDLVGFNLAFEQEELTADAASAITITFDNQDEGVEHNVVFFDGPDDEAERIAETAVEVGPIVQTLTFGPLEPGGYYYHCDIHPTTMTGELTVQ
ncbi:MAG: cupredoxin domain-containing protein [Dehalococcoidia bacterium]